MMMRHVEYRAHPERSTWTPGALWENEPDKAQFVDEATGLPCLAVRGPFGAWCGYVGVSKGHPFHGVEYNSCAAPENCGESFCNHSPESVIDIHGGITYSSFCQVAAEENAICHLVGDGEDEHLWWLGFDCAHYGDFLPFELSRALMPREFDFLAMLKDGHSILSGGIYRDYEWLKGEIANLAKQLKAIEA